MAHPDFSGDPFSRTDPTAGGAGDDALKTHMRAFAKAVKSGDIDGMATAFKAAHEECAGGYEGEGGGEAQDMGGMMG